MSRSSYECDCSSVPDASPFQIEECESPESEACEEGQLQSDYAFCTNGGKCISMIRHGEPHSGCLCNEEFEGRHCQYRRGEAPHFELKLAYKEKEQSPLVNFLLVVGMGVIAIVFLIVVKKSKQEKEVVVEADAEPSVSLSKEETEDEVEKEVSKGEMA